MNSAILRQKWFEGWDGERRAPKGAQDETRCSDFSPRFIRGSSVRLL